MLGLIRNQCLSKRSVLLPEAMSKTIIRYMFKSGHVLDADTRAAKGSIVTGMNCEKVRPDFHYSRMLVAHKLLYSLHGHFR